MMNGIVIFILLYSIGQLSADECTSGKVITGYLPQLCIDNNNVTDAIFNESSRTLTPCVKQCCDAHRCDVVCHIEHTCIGYECVSAESCERLVADSAASFIRVRRAKSATIISVTITGPQVIQLNGHDDKANFYANVDGTLANQSLYTFQWKLVESILLPLPTPNPELSINIQNYPLRSVDDQSPLMSNHWNLNELEIYKLSPGNFTIEVDVTSNQNPPRKGTAQMKFQVLPVLHKNQPPTAVISPYNITTVEGTAVLLDGSQSFDPDGDKLIYKWEPISGPAISGDYQTELSTLKFDTLAPGFYRFGLIVIDNQGAKSKMAEATVFVTKQRDDRPHAIVGQCGSKVAGSFTVKLPLDSIRICANESTDDHGIVMYQWQRMDNENMTTPQADVQGIAQPVLILTNIQPGSYTFKLTITDTGSQTDETTLTVVVNSADNQPPVANAGKNIQKELSQLNNGHSVILNGSLSSDDVNITSYRWSQTGGPKATKIVNANMPMATASGLDEIGEYTFQLNVTDSGNLSVTSPVVFTIVPGTNAPPVLRIANQTRVNWVCETVKLDACASTDDAGIVNWYWSPMPDNDADQRIMSESESHCSVHVPCSRVNATASYNITICDAAPLCVTRIIDVIVEPNDADSESIEILIDHPVSQIKNTKLIELDKKLSALVSSNEPIIAMVIHNIKQLPRQPLTQIEAHFVGETMTDGKEVRTILNAQKIVADLIGNIKSLQAQFQIVEIRSKYCKRTCSDHGVCDTYTHECICNRYWMPNILSKIFLSSENDCDWSVLYFTLSMIVLLTILIAYCWRGRLLFLMCRHCCGLRYKYDDNRRGMTTRSKARSYAAKTARYYNKKKELVLRNLENGGMEDSKLLTKLSNGTRNRALSTSSSSSSSLTEHHEMGLLVDVSPAKPPTHDDDLQFR